MHQEVLLSVLTDHFEFAILNVGKLVNDQVGVVSTEVVEENGDLVIYRLLKITLLMSSGNEQTRNVVVITHFGSSRMMVSLELFATYVAVSRNVKHLLLSATKPIYLDIVCQMVDAHLLPVDQSV